MIIGLGNDIVEIGRINHLYKKFGNRFLNKIYTGNEINLFNQNKSRLFYRLANRFAAKEATSKALGMGFSDGITLKNIEILNDLLNKPNIKLIGAARKRFVYLKNKKKNEILSISLSNERNYAVASVNIIFYW